MAKRNAALSKMPDKIVRVTWPILEQSKRDIRSNVLGVLDLIRSQLDNDLVTIFHIMTGNLELNGLAINYGQHTVTINYRGDIRRNSLEILFVVPDPENKIR